MNLYKYTIKLRTASHGVYSAVVAAQSLPVAVKQLQAIIYAPATCILNVKRELIA